MKNVGIFAVVLVLVVSFSTVASGQTSSKVLLIPREGYSMDPDLMIKMELGVMRLLLKNAKLDVDVATATGNPIIGPTEKFTDIKQLRTIKLDEYAGVIIACMAVGGAIQPPPGTSPEVLAIVKKAVADGKPVATNGNASNVLAEAGVLKGRKYSYVRDPLIATDAIPFTLPVFKDAVYSGSGLVQDGLIITSGICPTIEKTSGVENGTVKLTKAFIAAVQKK